jgi:hypothetical protein
MNASSGWIIDDVMLIIIQQLRVTTDANALIKVLMTCRGSHHWVRAHVYAALLSPDIADPCAEFGVQPRLRAITSCVMFTNIATNFFDRLKELIKCPPIDCTGATLIWDGMLCALRIIRFAVEGTRLLHERYDQEAGFTPNYQFRPLTSHPDIYSLSIGELYFYSDDTKEYIALMDCCLAPNFKSRAQFVDIHKLDVVTHATGCEIRMYCAAPSTDYSMLTSAENAREIETKPTHSLISLLINGYPLLNCKNRDTTKKLHVYSGRPHLFRQALWLDACREDVATQLMRRASGLARHIKSITGDNNRTRGERK